jgi:hypothetical protein
MSIMSKIAMNKNALSNIVSNNNKIQQLDNISIQVEDMKIDLNIPETVLVTPEIVIPSLDSYNVEIFTLSYCGWCNKVKEILNNADLEYTEYMLDDKSLFLTVEELLNNSGTTESHEDVYYVFDSLFKNPSILENLDIIMNGGTIDNEEDFELAMGIGQYLLDHEEILPILDFYIDGATEKDAVVKKFVDFIETNQTGGFVPQISVDGKYFGSHSELASCIEQNGDLEHCLFDFTNKINL